MSLEIWQLLSYVVTVLGLPLAMLISLFERAYLVLYEPNLTNSQLRRWRSWQDYMLEWLRRDAFRAQLPELVKG